MKRSVKYLLSVLAAAVVIGSLCGCGGNDAKQTAEIEKPEDHTSDVTIEEVAEGNEMNSVTTAESSFDRADEENHLDRIEPDPTDDNWYMKGNVYKSDDGHYAEVFFDDEGMLEFAVDGLSLYYSHVDKVQYENDWRIYNCEDGTTVVYYPGEPAHLEIYGDGDPTLYEENGDEMK